MDDRLRDADALLITLGQVADEPPAGVLQATAFLGGFARAAALRAREAVQRRSNRGIRPP